MYLCVRGCAESVICFVYHFITELSYINRASVDCYVSSAKLQIMF